MTAEEAYRGAMVRGWSQDLEDIVVKSGDPYYAFHFARNIKKANTPRLEQVIVNSGDPFWAYSFARYVPNANISDLIDFVLINDLDLIRRLFDEKPSLRHKYELGEIRRQIRRSING